MNEVPRSFRYWFYAAAAYNALWGLVVCVFPSWCISFLGIEGLVTPPFLQVLGMMVGVFGLGYWLLARDPVRYAGFVWIGIAGKVLGPVGFFFYLSRGDLPASFWPVIALNDLVWLPAFIVFAFRCARRPLG